MKRTPSFRPEDITQVKLESTTNKQVDQLEELPVRCRSPTLDAVRVESLGHRYEGHDHTKPPPQQPLHSVGAHGEGSGIIPTRPPPPLPKYQLNNPSSNAMSSAAPATEEETIYYANLGTHHCEDSPPPPYSAFDNNEPPPALPPRPARFQRGDSSNTSTDNNHTSGQEFPAKKPQVSAEVPTRKPPTELGQGVSSNSVANARRKFEAEPKTKKNPIGRVPPNNTGLKPAPPSKPTKPVTKVKSPSQNAADSKENSSQGPPVSGKKPQLKPKPSLNLNQEPQGSAEC